MYSGLPTTHRRIVTTSLALSWLMSAGAGMSAVLRSPGFVIHELGLWGTLLAGASLAFAAGAASLGVATKHYRWEWVSAWVSAAALSPYILTIWAAVFTGSNNSTQAFLATSLLGFYVTRAFLCAAHAAKLRLAHESAQKAIDSVNDEGDSDGHRAGSE